MLRKMQSDGALFHILSQTSKKRGSLQKGNVLDKEKKKTNSEYQSLFFCFKIGGKQQVACLVLFTYGFILLVAESWCFVAGKLGTQQGL